MSTLVFMLLTCSAVDAGKSAAVKQADVHIGREEFEYLEIDCKALTDTGEIGLELAIPESFTGKADLFVEENYRLLNRNTMDVEPDERNSVWIRFSTHGADAGSYPFIMTLSPKHKDPIKIHVNLTVWPIDLPRSDNVYVNAFWASFCCIFGEGKLYPDVRDREKMLELWDYCNEDMADFGQNFMEIRFKREIIEPFIKVSHLEEGYLPILDFTGWDDIISISRKHGMRHAIFRYGYGAENWYPPNYESLSSEQQEKVTFSILRQMIDHLKKRGFERIFWYLIDEIDPYTKVIVPVCEKMEKHRAEFPELEFSGSGFAHIPLKESHGGEWKGVQDLADHLTWIAPYWKVHSIFKWIETGELKLLPNTIVATQIAAGHEQPYLFNRARLWALWLEGGNGYQIYGYHTYYPEHKYSPVFPGPENTRPIYSPVYASLVDGYEDFEYLHRCSERLAELEASGSKEDAAEFRNGLESILGGSDSLLKVRLADEPAPYDRGKTRAPDIAGDEQDLREARRRIMELLIRFDR